ncbi:sulfotransferase family 2 domain-containing protein [Pimelobacter simplex]|uniref:Uncharacterized protein n=1 Tax=Nocardioides simplex TaxID=2045 RepID=A0A0A1DFL0_NOCSI|nr:sulfotransferase family 2 domain-containing protein [Pimelobacter simplex]AIY16051.1 hypothetical protein KR76_03455 [Pimelobacter simplex]MCG8151060.1 sulfotransferase family 2 domain-containing protein [Pimelobacter simplex]GEB12309.1 hypothetical protein NSI01_06240 [Pimelobacter simplex]SFM96799.1 Sulfotransferase family protein [Pimelobacter simplex]
MPVFFKDDKKVLFIHVPKVGGTTMERMFRASGWQMRFHATSTTEPNVRPLRRCTPQHYHGALLREVFNLQRIDLTFMLVREPLARFRSEYVMRNADNPRVDAASVEAWADRVLKVYEVNPYVRDNHIRPQHEFAVEGTVVHRLEDGLDVAADDIARRLGTPLRRDVERGQVSHDKAGVPSSAVEISPALEERLREFYAEDFRTFGY